MTPLRKRSSVFSITIAFASAAVVVACSTASSPTNLDREEEVVPGLEATLFAPLGLTTTYLIDDTGGVVHTWESNYRPALSAYLLSDSSLLRTAALASNGPEWKAGGSGGRVERFDWNGNLIWEFDYSSNEHRLHHDIEYLSNGNILMVAWEYKTAEESLAAGRDPALLVDGELWPDKIIEVRPSGASGGTVVWEWHVWDHLIQDHDPSKANHGVVSEHPERIDLNFVLRRGLADWTHINAVDYNADLDRILLTVHNFGEIWVIDHNTTTEEAAGPAGDLLFRWGNPQAYDRGSSGDQKLFVPHDAQWIEAGLPGAGDILVFNNGQNRPDGDYSTVDQITPPEDGSGGYTLSVGAAFGPAATTWTYRAHPATTFFASHISGAQRLPNGNTLICDGPAGVFFEVTEGGESLWEYVNPFSSDGQPGNEVFRAERHWLPGS